MWKASGVSLLAGLILGACAHGQVFIGEDFPDENVPKIQQGVTTMEEVEQLFGPPRSIQVTHDFIVWTYVYIPTEVEVWPFKGWRLVDVDTKTDMKHLRITFWQGHVSTFEYSTAGDFSLSPYEQYQEYFIPPEDEDLSIPPSSQEEPPSD